MRRGTDMKEPEQTEPPYYTLDTLLFSGKLQAIDGGKNLVEVRGKAHLSDEQYRLRNEEKIRRPIPTVAGERNYIHMKPYVLIPDLLLTVELYSHPRNYADLASVIGKVQSRHEAPHKREIEIGQMQAWHYPQDKIVEIWECFLTSRFRDNPLLRDENMKRLWIGVEHFLRELFPLANQIVTPWHDPEFDSNEYEHFLQTRGFIPVAKAAYGKAVHGESPTS
jgi:hypothetical protein